VRAIRRANSARLVGADWNVWSAAEWCIQATLLYFPRSMARMGPAAVGVSRVVAVVVMGKLRVEWANAEVW
jgi:hypothetical protein